MPFVNALPSGKIPQIEFGALRPWRPMQIYLQTRAAESPLRFCSLTLQPDFQCGWIVTREIGFQGARGAIRNEYFASYAAATRALEQARDAQLVNGTYKITFVSGHPPV